MRSLACTALLAALLAPLLACGDGVQRCNADRDCIAGLACVGGGCALVIDRDGVDELDDAPPADTIGTGGDDDGATTPVDDDATAPGDETGGTGTGGAPSEGEGEGDAAGGEGEGEGDVPVIEPAPSTLERWKRNQPDDAGGNQDCLALEGDQWDDRDCSIALPFVCDLPATASAPDCLTDTVAGRLRALCLTPASADGAAAVCAGFGGALARVDTDGEHDAFVDALNDQQVAAVWLGGSDRGVEGVWRWPDGARLPSPFSNWAADRPNGGLADDCMVVRISGTGAVLPEQWDDRTCSDQNAFVCDAPATGAATPAGCAERSVAGKRRLFCSALRDAADARDFCASQGGALARIDSVGENEALVAAGAGVIVGDVWVGGRDGADEGVWRWPDGALFDLVR